MTQPGAAPRTHEPLPFWDWLDAGLFLGLAVPSFALALALTQGIFLLAPDYASLANRSLALQFAGYGFLFASLWLMLRVRYHREFWPSMAWIIPWPRMGQTVFLGPVLVLVVVVLGLLLRTPEVDSPMQKLLQDRSSLVIIGIFATTLGPLAEELIFRGFLQPLLVQRLGAVVGILIASAPFALLHGPQYAWSWRHILLLFFASNVFGVIRHKTGSTAASTFVHATYNLTFYTGFLLQRKELLF